MRTIFCYQLNLGHWQIASEGPTCIILCAHNANSLDYIIISFWYWCLLAVLALVHWWRDISGAKRGASILVQLSLVHEPILTTAIPPERAITHILIPSQLSVVGKIITLTLMMIISMMTIGIITTSSSTNIPFFWTQVSQGSDLWVRMSVSESKRFLQT